MQYYGLFSLFVEYLLKLFRTITFMFTDIKFTSIICQQNVSVVLGWTKTTILVALTQTMWKNIGRCSRSSHKKIRNVFNLTVLIIMNLYFNLIKGS